MAHVIFRRSVAVRALRGWGVPEGQGNAQASRARPGSRGLVPPPQPGSGAGGGSPPALAISNSLGAGRGQPGMRVRIWPGEGNQLWVGGAGGAWLSKAHGWVGQGCGELLALGWAEMASWATGRVGGTLGKSQGQ